MKHLFSLLTALLLLQPVLCQDKPNKVKGITLPEAVVVNATDYQKRIIPTFDDPGKVVDVKWIVISSGAGSPEYRITGAGKLSTLYVTVPEDKKDAYLIYCYALYGGDKPWMTDAASTILEWQGQTPTTPTVPTQPPTNPTQPPTQPTQPPTNPTVPTTTPVEQVFASVKNIHAILVLDVQSANQEVAVLTQNKTGFQKIFEKPGTNNHWWQYDIRTATKQSFGKNLVDAQGKLVVQLPVVVLIDANTTPAKMIGNPLPVQLTGNPVNTISSLLTNIATVLKK